MTRSIVSKQEARICDLENKLEFQRGQVKRFEVSPDPVTALCSFSDRIFTVCVCVCVGAGSASAGQCGAAG